MEYKELFAEGNLPKAQEVAQLPIWACLAFSSASTRIAQDYIVEEYSNIPKEYLNYIEECIQTGEEINHKDFKQLKQRGKSIFELLNKLRVTESETATSLTQGLVASQMVVYVAHVLYTGHHQYIANDTVSCILAVAKIDDSLVPKIRNLFNQILRDARECIWSDISVTPIFKYRKYKKNSQQNTYTDINANNYYSRLIDGVKTYINLSNSSIQPFDIIWSDNVVTSNRIFDYYIDELSEYQENENINCNYYLKLLIGLGIIYSYLYEPTIARLYYLEAYQIFKSNQNLDENILLDILLCLILWERDYGCYPDELMYLEEYLDILSIENIDLNMSITYIRCLDRYIYILINLGQFDKVQTIERKYNLIDIKINDKKVYNKFDDLRWNVAILKLKITLCLTEQLISKQTYHHQLKQTELDDYRQEREDKVLNRLEQSQKETHWIPKIHKDKQDSERMMQLDIDFEVLPLLKELQIQIFNYKNHYLHPSVFQVFLNYIEVCAEIKSLLSESIPNTFIICTSITLDDLSKPFLPYYEDRNIWFAKPYNILYKLAKGLNLEGNNYNESILEDIYKSQEAFAKQAQKNPKYKKMRKVYPNFYFEFLFDYGLCHLENDSYVHYISPHYIGVAGSHNELIDEFTHIQKENINKASKIFKESIKFLKFDIERIFILLDENSQINFLNKIKDVIEFLVYFFAVLDIYDPQRAEILFELTSIFKGLLYDKHKLIRSLVNNTNNAKTNGLFKELNSYRTLMDSETETNNFQEQVDNMNHIESALIQSLRTDVLNKALNVIPIPFSYGYEISQKLSSDTCFVNIIRFRSPAEYFRGRGFDTTKVSYLVLICTPKQDLKVILLNNANVLEGDSLTNIYEEYMEGNLDDELSLILYKKYWYLIHEQIKEYKKVFLSPEGIFTKINIEVLLIDQNTYIGDIYDINIVRSANELLDKVDTIFYDNTATLVGGIDYGEIVDRDKNVTNFEELGYSLKEIKQVNDILKNKQWQVETFSGNNISKNLLLRNTPRFLHVATHTHFNGQARHPLLKVGLALSNINKGLVEQSILTALDIMSANYDKTELVILSACTSIEGELIFGQGSYNLPYAFRAGGVQNIIASTFNISDYYTSKLMSVFYEKLLENENISIRKALKLAQKQVRENRPEPKYWGSFVFIGVG